MTVLAIFSVDTTQASNKPETPVVNVIQARTRSAAIDVTVKFTDGTGHVKYPVLSYQVKVGTRSCSVGTSLRKCTVKNLRKNTTYQVRVRSRNRFGYSKWSSSVAFTAQKDQLWRRENGESNGPGGDMSTTTSMTPTTIKESTLRFDLQNAIGLALASNSGTVAASSVSKVSTGSNLQKIDKDGNLTDAVSSGAVKVQRFLIAPNDKLYVEFAEAVSIDRKKCVLAEVSRASGTPTCIETDEYFRFMGSRQNPTTFCDCNEHRPLRNDIQFDAAGNIYYAGIPGGWRAQYPTRSLSDGQHVCAASPCGKASVVRRYSYGATQDFGSSAIGVGGVDIPWHWASTPSSMVVLRPIYNFLVLDNGDVVIHGERDLIRVSTDACPKCYQIPEATELWSTTGTLLEPEISSGSTALLSKIDGQTILMTKSDHGQPGFRVVTFRQDGSRTISNISNEGLAGCLSGESRDLQRFGCSTFAVRQVWRTPKGEIFAILGHDPFSLIENFKSNKSIYESWVEFGAKYGSGVLLKILPSVEATRVGQPRSNDDLVRIETFSAALHYLFASGVTSDGRRHTIMFDTNTDEMRVLIPASEGILVTSLAFSAASNRLIVAGIREASRQDVFGLVNVETGAAAWRSGQAGVEEIQAYGS